MWGALPGRSGPRSRKTDCGLWAGAGWLVLVWALEYLVLPRLLLLRYRFRLMRLAQTLNCSMSLAGAGSNVAQEALAGSSVACLGSEARLMNQRLDADLKATLGS